MKNKLLYIIIAIIIIIGAVMFFTKGFNKNIMYSNRQEIIIVDKTEIDVSKIYEISKSVLQGKKVKVQRIERFKNAVEVIAEEISNEEKDQIINKIKEECEIDIPSEEVEIQSVPEIRVKDTLKKYILPITSSFAAILLYFIIIYNKIGINKILLKGIIIPICTELVYYSIILMSRMPFSEMINSIAAGLYAVSMVALSIHFSKEKLKIKEKKEND